MNPEFWQEAWAAQRIGFHNPFPSPILVEFLPQFDLSEGDSILVPMCGKSLDMHWMRAVGFKVVGAELVETAVITLFEDLGLTPEIVKSGDHIRYSAKDIVVFVGDLFTLTPEQVGAVDFVYDRAALNALPADMRAQYVPKILALSKGAPQMIIIFEYDQTKSAGPPFSLETADIDSYYAQTHSVVELLRKPVEAESKLRPFAGSQEVARALHVR